MQHREASLLWSSLNLLTKERHDALVSVYGSLEEATKHLGEEMLRGLGCRQETIVNALLALEAFDADRSEGELRDRGITFIEISQGEYPSALREIGDPPPFLYAKGDLSILSQPCVALVGTRQMSTYGRNVVDAFVPPMVRAGVVTVSGLARGVDARVADDAALARWGVKTHNI